MSIDFFVVTTLRCKHRALAFLSAAHKRAFASCGDVRARHFYVVIWTGRGLTSLSVQRASEPDSQATAGRGVAQSPSTSRIIPKIADDPVNHSFLNGALPETRNPIASALAKAQTPALVRPEPEQIHPETKGFSSRRTAPASFQELRPGRAAVLVSGCRRGGQSWGRRCGLLPWKDGATLILASATTQW